MKQILKNIFTFLSLLLCSISISSCSSDSDDDFDFSEYKIYKVLVTYKNCDVIEQNGKSTIIMSDNSRVSSIEIVEPDYIKITKKDCVKLYNTDFVDDEATPEILQEGPNTISFAISTVNEENEPFIFNININVMYSKYVNPDKTFRRLYTVYRKSNKETIETPDDLSSFIDNNENIPDGFTRYKVLITYDNADLVKKDEKDVVLIWSKSSVSNIELIEPEYAVMQNALKFYNGNVNSSNQVPSSLQEGFNKISFVLTMFNPISNRSNSLSINADVYYSKTEKPTGTLKRLYIIDRKTDKETVK